jgi:recombination protein RecA
MPGKLSPAQMKKALEKFEKAHGAGTIEIDAAFSGYDVIPTGSMDLDYALGVGGIVIGRQHEWWGPDGIGKSTMGYITMAEAQRAYPDRLVGLINVEQKLDKPWVWAHGVDKKRCLLSLPDTAEDVADALKDMMRDFEPVIVFIDSVGALIAEAEMEKDAGDDYHGGKKAQIVTRMVNIAAVEARKHECAVVYINQVRANVSGFGKATTTGGGWALRHCTTSKLEFKRTGTEPYKIKMADGETVQVGHEVAIKVERNGVAPAYRTAFVNLFNQDTKKYGPLGIDRATEAVNVGLKTGVIEQQAGGYYVVSVTGERVRGRDALIKSIRKDPTSIDAIREAVIATRASEVHDDDEVPDAPPPATEDKPEGKRGFKKADDLMDPADRAVPQQAVS